jgi:hypothetical protein
MVADVPRIFSPGLTPRMLSETKSYIVSWGRKRMLNRGPKALRLVLYSVLGIDDPDFLPDFHSGNPQSSSVRFSPRTMTSSYLALGFVIP